MDITIPSISAISFSIHPAILIGLLGGYILFSVWVIFAMQFSNLMSLKSQNDWKADLKWYLLFFPGTIMLILFMAISKVVIKLVGPKNT
jgi:hypothetical protein